MAIRNIVKIGDDILRKVCRTQLNFDERLATVLDDMADTDGIHLPGKEDTFQEYRNKELESIVIKALEGIKPQLRTVFTLRVWGGLTYEEIAETMDCPIGTVRSRIFRAREAIATQLRPLLDTTEFVVYVRQFHQL